MPTVRDIITDKVVSVGPEATLADAARTMVLARVGAALIIDGPWLLGIFTERDGLRACAEGAPPHESRVIDWMTREPMTVEPDSDSEEAAAIMATHGFRHLPVVDGDTVVGVVGLRDAVRKTGPHG